MNLIANLSRFLNIPEEELESIINSAQNSYKRYQIIKKNGGKRTIFQPSSSLKAVQYAIINLFLCKLPIHNISYGYRKGLKSPLRLNAELHAKYNYSVRIDFENFFPSLKSKDLFYFLEKNKVLFSDNEKGKLSKLIFPNQYISSGLPIGSPISPIISNIVMYELDAKIELISKDLSLESSISRYADDIIFSSNQFELCNKFIVRITDLIKSTDTPKLTINKNKTIFMSKKNRRMITGLLIMPDGKISIGRNRKRLIKNRIFEFVNNKLDEKEQNKLRGNLAFILDVEPSFYNSLVMKYGKIVNQVMNK